MLDPASSTPEADRSGAPSGGCTNTMLPHFGQANIWSTADASRTLSRA